MLTDERMCGRTTQVHMHMTCKKRLTHLVKGLEDVISVSLSRGNFLSSFTDSCLLGEMNFSGPYYCLKHVEVLCVLLICTLKNYSSHGVSVCSVWFPKQH
jgi:hypothetical protein